MSEGVVILLQIVSHRVMEIIFENNFESLLVGDVVPGVFVPEVP